MYVNGGQKDERQKKKLDGTGEECRVGHQNMVGAPCHFDGPCHDVILVSDLYAPYTHSGRTLRQAWNV